MPPMHLKSEIDTLRQPFDRFNTEILRGILHEHPLRPDLTEEEIIDTFRRYQDFLNAGFRSDRGVSLVFTGIVCSVLTEPEPELAVIVKGTIAAAAVINEIMPCSRQRKASNSREKSTPHDKFTDQKSSEASADVSELCIFSANVTKSAIRYGYPYQRGSFVCFTS